MDEIYNKYQKLDQLIKKYHNESFYSKILYLNLLGFKTTTDEKILNSLKFGQRIYGENKYRML